mgnify:CR=1 FL=1
MSINLLNTVWERTQNIAVTVSQKNLKSQNTTCFALLGNQKSQIKEIDKRT